MENMDQWFPQVPVNESASVKEFGSPHTRLKSGAAKGEIH